MKPDNISMFSCPPHPLAHSNSTKNCFLYACDGSHPFKVIPAAPCPNRSPVLGLRLRGLHSLRLRGAHRQLGLRPAGHHPGNCAKQLRHRQVEESFKTADVALCRAICNSMSTCSHYTWAPASLACGLRTTPPGGMVSLPAEVTTHFPRGSSVVILHQTQLQRSPKLTQH